MKRTDYLLIFLYTLLILAVIIHSIFGLFDFQWTYLLEDLSKLRAFLFIGFGLTVALTILMILLIKLIQFTIMNTVQKNLRNLLEGKKLKLGENKEINEEFQRLDRKLKRLTENLQRTENRVMQNEEEIVERERRRIARDLHDTVSQELFAANMILSGVASQDQVLQLPKVGQQLKGVTEILNTAQNDLRILLLHLRPTELEGRNLVEGLQVIFRELQEKSNLEVYFEHDLQKLPKSIEEHIFRIVQEVVSNTLKHAHAKRLDVYLLQTEQSLHLKLADDGVGFDPESLGELSYGMKNIQDRVDDMAGRIKILTSPKKGVAIDIKVPLVEGEDDEIITSR